LLCGLGTCPREPGQMPRRTAEGGPGGPELPELGLVSSCPHYKDVRLRPLWDKAAETKVP
jgi:hypothetical protein